MHLHFCAFFTHLIYCWSRFYWGQILDF